MTLEFTVVERPVYRGWEIVSTASRQSVHITEPNFITEHLLPTFSTKIRTTIDPQFLIDFKRARPHADNRDLTATWSINGKPAPRSPHVLLGILGCQQPMNRLRITQLYNQRCGIDICRRIKSLYDDDNGVLPKSSSYTLDLKLLPGESVSIQAATDVDVFEYTPQGLVGKSVDSVHVDATYDLGSGRVCYNIVRK